MPFCAGQASKDVEISKLEFNKVLETSCPIRQFSAPGVSLSQEIPSPECDQIWNIKEVPTHTTELTLSK